MIKPRKTTIALSLENIQGAGYHLLCPIYIGKTKYRALIDTGASHTMVHVGLSGFLMNAAEVSNPENKAVGFGTAPVQIKAANIPMFKLGKLIVEGHAVGLVDMEHIIDIYTDLGILPFQVIIGSDILLNFGAVINFSKRKMTLKTGNA